MSMTKKIVLCMSPIFMAIVWWSGGYNFDERGHLAVSYAICTAFVIGFIWVFPER